MIERIENGMMVLRPIAKAGQQARNIGIEIKKEISKPADYLYNPDLADKINVSRESIKDEIGLLKEADLGIRNGQQGDHNPNDEASSASSLDVLERSLIRMTSLLYQIASVVAADPDSLEALQRKLAEELRGYEKVFDSVRLVEIASPDLKLDDLDIRGKINAESLNSKSVAAARETISAAENVAARMLSQIKEEEAEQSRTEAVLSTIGQNLAAAESAFYPEETISRAREVSLALRDTILGALGAQAHLNPDDVFMLTSPS
ncbi:MAG: hypothetical protein KAT85_00500 [candidate division Zixibacteria bacterium]|nr:hypothetical protein [candidate division Zixibacteria bacterium]